MINQMSQILSWIRLPSVPNYMTTDNLHKGLKLAPCGIAVGSR